MWVCQQRTRQMDGIPLAEFVSRRMTLQVHRAMGPGGQMQ